MIRLRPASRQRSQGNKVGFIADKPARDGGAPEKRFIFLFALLCELCELCGSFYIRYDFIIEEHPHAPEGDPGKFYFRLIDLRSNDINHSC